jgi:hypothetical protein
MLRADGAADGSAPDVEALLASLPAVAARPGMGRPAAATPGSAVEATSRAATARAAPAGTVSVNRVQRDLGLLDPEFRVRFERVIERMESEYGHRVTVVETHRHQARQDHLYDQGRTRPGPVVTWTRNSSHTQGRAADVMIDGTYDNAVGYRRLARIAQEEGLRTLGPRDPGHVELPRGAAGRAAPVPHAAHDGHAHAPRSVAQPPRAAGGVAAVAAVATPVAAPVAAVAPVAARSPRSRGSRCRAPGRRCRPGVRRRPRARRQPTPCARPGRRSRR